MRYPENLKEKGRLGFIAPSFGAATEPYKTCFLAALSEFEKRGYETVKGSNCFEDSGLGKSNTPEKCAAEVNDFFKNDRCDVIISCGGGETMCEDLNFIDFEGIKNAPPKWFMGYSDNTNLTFTLTVLTDTAAIYGPCVSNFGMQPWHESVADALALLRGEKLTMKSYDLWEKEKIKDEEHPLLPYNVAEPFCMKAYVPGDKTDGFVQVNDVKVSGRLIGGCLDCLQTLCGTRFDKVKEFSEKYKEDGILWFIEACDLNPMGIRRALWQLKNAGWFENVKGFLIGRPLDFDADFAGMNRINAVLGALEEFKVPVIMDLDIGHLPPMMPLISGAVGEASAQDGKFSIEMKLL